jgi:hypothetical protein
MTKSNIVSSYPTWEVRDVETGFALIREAYGRWGEQYASARFRYAAVPHDGRLTLLRGSLEFRRDRPGKASVRDYGAMTLEEVHYAPEEALEAIEEILSGLSVRGTQIEVSSAAEVRPWNHRGRNLPAPSHERSWKNEWPGFMAVLGQRQPSVNEPNGPLAKADLPLIVQPRDAIADWIGYNPDEVNDLHRGVALVLPDFRARISEILLGESEARVTVETSIRADKLLLKSSYRYEDRWEETTPELSEGHAVVPLVEGLPSTLAVFLLDSEADEVLDWQEVYLGWTDLPSNVAFQLPKQRFDYLIEAGESDTLEYKELVNRGEWSRVMEDIVAMANHEGGNILIGVSNEAEVKGVLGSFPTEDDLARAVREWIHPYLDCDVTPVDLRGRTVLVVEVPEGREKPYFHRSKGPLVRRGSNNFPMPRDEVQGHFTQRTGYW